LGKSKEIYGEHVGYVVDNSTPSYVKFVSTNPPPVGDYVVIDRPGKPILGFVESVGTRSITLSSLPGSYDPQILDRLRGEALKTPGDTFFECTAYLLGDVENLEMTRTPPLPGDLVYRASDELLSSIFGPRGREYIEIGVLVTRPDVKVSININRMVTRHAAILAITGAGKSNTVSIVADRIVEMGGTLLIFDFHGEYVYSDLGKGRLNVIEPLLSPRLLSFSELQSLLGIPHNAHRQEYVFRQAYRSAKESREQRGFLEDIRERLEDIARQDDNRENRRAAIGVINRLEVLMERYGEILEDVAPRLIDLLKPGYVNVLNLSRVDEEAADVIVSHVLRTMLYERKKHKLGEKSRLQYPVLLVIEEAHILAPKDRDTSSKYWLARIAREGRKFGLGLLLVSQRPKILDPNVLSQANNMFILKIVEPSDQRHVQAASESLSDNLLVQLPSLNVGEAVVIGPMIRLPALVKIYKYEGRLGGADPNVVEEWIKYRESLYRDSRVVEDIMSQAEEYWG